MRRAVLVGAVLALGAGAATAHEGVRNPAVLAWMENMKQIGAATGVLGSMAKVERAFDPAAADAALRQIATAAEQSPALFETPHSDPKSEALPAIWENWSDFEAQSVALEDLARGLEGTLASPDALRDGLRQIGASCKSCHALYRE